MIIHMETPSAEEMPVTHYFFLRVQRLTCAGTYPHDGVKSNGSLHVASQIRQETLTIQVRLKKYWVNIS